MKKGILVFSILALAFVGGYALTTTMTDLFAVGDTGSGPLFRISSTGGIVNSGANTFGGATTQTGALGVTGLITATGGVTVPSGATLTLASGSTLVSTGMVVMQGITGANGLLVTNHVRASSFTATTGAYGYQAIGMTNLVYTVFKATTMAAGSSVDLTQADGKIGGFDIICSTIQVTGSFIADGTVSLCARAGSSQSTTASNAITLNVSDGGTVVRVTQNAFSTAVVYIKYWFIE